MDGQPVRISMGTDLFMSFIRSISSIRSIRSTRSIRLLGLISNPIIIADGLNMRPGAQSWCPEIMAGKVKAHEWCGNALVFTF